MSATGTFETDYETATERCGLLDRSERGKLALTGSGAREFLQGQVSNDVLALTPGTGCYAAFLTPKGKMLGDLRILDAGEELLLDTERSGLQELFDMIRRFSLGHDVQLAQAHARVRSAFADRTRRRCRRRRRGTVAARGLWHAAEHRARPSRRAPRRGTTFD